MEFDGLVITDWWRTDAVVPCWVCGDLTDWVYLDLGHQHPDCDKYPIEGGDMTIIKGRRVKNESN